MSWGTTGNSITGATIMTLAQARGVLLIAAAGNSDTTAPFYPAAYTQTLAVGSTNALDEKSSFSNYGSYIDVMAPGSAIKSCLGDAANSYGNFSGTSMACPLVAGLAGLVFSADPNLTEQQVRTMIINGCENIDQVNPTYVGQMGAGRINAANTMNMVSVGVDAPAAATFFHIGPNPATDDVTVRFEADMPGEMLELSVLDLGGRMVAQRSVRVQPGLNEERFDLSELAEGMYVVRISGKYLNASGRIVKKQ